MHSNFLTWPLLKLSPVRSSLRIIILCIIVSIISACSHLQLPTLGSEQITSSERVNEADKLYYQGLYSEARSAYLSITRDYPEFSYGWFKLANTSSRIGQPEEAVLYYKRAISLDEGDQRYWHNLSLAYLQLARQTARTAVSRNLTAVNTDLLQLISQIDAAGER
ncbi:tetratricopeptide repeat protein [Allohahella marinimesophila]|uniref:Tetratricopeptide repeat protein n=1 Tax=Allohahella marinimesophila TaxID=1054972 RepID=A0ABP7PPL8_9GAMM